MASSHSPKPAPDTRPRLAIPFTGPLFYKLRHLAKQLNINLITASSPTLASKLCSRVKFPVEDKDKSGVVYSIRCSCGGTYTGESGRTLGVRTQEHTNDWKKGRVGSPWASHSSHQPNFQEPTILGLEKKWWKRRIKEALAIKACHNNITNPNDANRNKSVTLGEEWDVLIPFIKKQLY